MSKENTSSISIIIPSFNEYESLSTLYAEIMQVVQEHGYTYEIIFINDGSTDKTAVLLEEIASSNQKVTIIHNLKKYGKSYCLQSAFDVAQHDTVVTLDADLQDDPSEIPKMLSVLAQGADMVCGWKKNRNDPLSKRLFSKVFNFVSQKLGGPNIHDMNCGLKVMTRRAMQSLYIYGELHRFIPFFASSYGFTVTEAVVNHRKRAFGKSKYGMSRVFHGFFDFFTVVYLTKFQGRPMHIFGSIGGTSALIGSVLFLQLCIEKVLFNHPLSQRPLLNISILLIIVGAQMGTFGLLGEQITFYNAEKQQRHKVKTIFKNGLRTNSD